MFKLSNLRTAAAVSVFLGGLLQACASTDNAGFLGLDAAAFGVAGGAGAAGAPGAAGATGAGNTTGAGNATGTGATTGTGAAAGTGAATGSGSATGAGGSTSSCKPSFCPASGTGTPCCMPDDTCGVDLGLGCTRSARDGGSGGTTSSGGTGGTAGTTSSGGSKSTGGSTSSGGSGPPPPVTDASVIVDKG